MILYHKSGACVRFFCIEYDMIRKIVLFVIMIPMLLLPAACGECGAFGELAVCVRDGFSDVPVPGARVCLPEADLSCVTDAQGRTPAMRVPVLPDSEYERLLPSGQGRVTVIVTAEGFTPCLLLYVRITKDLKRELEVLMFPADGSLSVFPVIEAPDEGWCRELVKKYAE